MPIVIDLDVMLARRKMGVAELAERVGITPVNISVLKNGRAKAIRFSTLEALCRELDCTPGDLLTADLAAAAARKPQAEIEEQASNGSPSIVRPRFNGNRPEPPL